jgi:putative inorganic carbon (HCO3(-)) transporter
MAFVILIVIIGLAFRGITKPFIGLLGLVVVYLVQPGELYPVLAPLHLERTLAVFVLGSFFFHGNRLRFPLVTKWFLGFYAVMLLSIPFAFWRGNSIEFCIAFAEIVVYHLLIVSLVTTEERFNQIIVVFVALMGWLSISSAVLYAEGVRIVTMGIERASGATSAGGDPNTLGTTLVSAMPLEFLLMLKGNNKWTRILALVVFAASVYVLIVTGSRTSFFAFGVCLLLIMLTDWRKRLKYLPIVLALSPLMWMAIPQQYKARYETVDNLKDDDSYQNRVLSWEGGIKMFEHNPVTGVGPQNYASANGMHYWPGKPRHFLDAHSLYFKLLGELALAGIVAFGGYTFTLFRLNARLLREAKHSTRGVIIRKFPAYCNVALLILFFAGYSGHNLYRNTWYVFGAFSAALGMLAPAAAKDGEESEPAPTKRRKPSALAPWLPPEAPALPAPEPAAPASGPRDRPALPGPKPPRESWQV